MFINGRTYACNACIHGHRSRSCKHTDRLLLQIAPKGRPRHRNPRTKKRQSLKKAPDPDSSSICPTHESDRNNDTFTPTSSISPPSPANSQLGFFISDHITTSQNPYPYSPELPSFIDDKLGSDIQALQPVSKNQFIPYHNSTKFIPDYPIRTDSSNDISDPKCIRRRWSIQSQSTVLWGAIQSYKLLFSMGRGDSRT